MYLRWALEKALSMLRGGAGQRFAERPLHRMLGRLPAQVCQSLDRLPGLFATHWSCPLQVTAPAASKRSLADILRSLGGIGACRFPDPKPLDP